MSDLTITYNEKDLFLFLQKDRLLVAKRINDENIEKTKNVKEDKATLKGVVKNVGNFFKRGAGGYDKRDESIDAAIQQFESKNPEIIDLATAEGLIESLFKNDKYGLSKLVFASSIILDDEYEYRYVDEGLEDVSILLYGDGKTLSMIKKSLFDNYNAISPKSLSNVQKGILLGVAVSSVVGVASIPLILTPGSAVAAGLAAHGFAAVGAITLESVLMSAAITGIVYGGMKLYNDEKVKMEFKKLSPEKNALYLALQCTYIERIKSQLPEDEFKEQLDSILKNLSTLKGDLDYYLFVEKESTKENKEKIKSFHEFDNRLSKVLGI